MLGVIEPRYRSVPAYQFSSGPEVADLCDLVGYAPDANQREVLDAIFAEDVNRRPASFEIAIICSRQNLKTAIMKQASLGWLFLSRQRLRVVYTAHEWNPACADMFKEMKQLVEGSSWLAKRVDRIYEGNGEESINLINGSQMLFKTRTKAGGRAMAGDKLLFDEGFALQASHIGSLMPIMSTRPEAQILYGSSPGKAESEVLRDVRDRGRAYIDDQGLADPQLAYFDWAAPPPAEACERGDGCDHGRGTVGCACDDPAMWQRANPAMGQRITVEYIGKERRSMPPAEFARERMGWWDDPVAISDAAINLQAWDNCEDADPDRAPKVVGAFAVDVAPDRSVASIGMAGRREDNRMHVEWIETRRGVAWITGRLLELLVDQDEANVVIDGGGSHDESGPQHRLIEVMREAGVPVVVAGRPDIAAACNQLVDGVNDRWIVHGPQPELQAAVAGARRRPAGDGAYVFGRIKSMVDITALYSVALAAWAADDSSDQILW